MSQKLPVNNFDWIKDTCGKSDKGCSLKVDVQYLEKLHELHKDLPFLLERIKIEKVEKFVANLHDKTEYVMHVRIKASITSCISLQQSLIQKTFQQ